MTNINYISQRFDFELPIFCTGNIFDYKKKYIITNITVRNSSTQVYKLTFTSTLKAYCPRIHIGLLLELQHGRSYQGEY